jgi:2-isopropylmalate synthase
VFVGKIAMNGEVRSVSGRGNGLLSSVLDALREELGVDLEVADYSEHAIGEGTDVNAAAYVECRTAEGKSVFGVGLDSDVATASVQAILSAANGLARRG